MAFDREGVLTQFIIDGELNVNVTTENAVKNRILLSNRSDLQFRVCLAFTTYRDLLPPSLLL